MLTDFTAVSGLILPCVAILSISVSFSIYPVIIVGSILLRFPSIRDRLLTLGCLAVGILSLVTANWLLNDMSWSFIEDTYEFM